MSKADEIFDELGYEKIHDNKRRIVYKEGWLGKIEFNIKGKWISIDFSIGLSELQAINAKCKELGWLDE